MILSGRLPVQRIATEWLDEPAHALGERAMIFTYIAPSPALRDFIRDYLILIAHFLFDEVQPVPLKPYAPKPEQGITFLVKGGASMLNRLTGEVQQAPPVSVFGQQLSRCDIQLAPEFLMFRVHFQPGALFRVLKIPLCELTEDYFDAELVLRRNVLDVSEQLTAAQSYMEMVTLVERYLLRLISSAKPDVHPIDKVAAHLTADPVRFSLDYLADQACLSPRQFNRKFTEHMRVGPKIYSRLVRFFHAYLFKEANPTVDWLTVAIYFGYTDYQHMVKDFKQFSDATPKTWLQEESASPEKILRLYKR